MARPSYIYTVNDITTGDIHKNLSCGEVSELTGIGKNKIGASVTPGRVCKGRYIITREEELAESDDVTKKIGMKMPQDIIDGWEEMRMAADILKSGKGRIVTKWENGKRVKYTEVRK